MANEDELRSYLRRVTIELAEERERMHAYRHEPIAIVGMAGRYPGGANTPEELWELVAEGRDGIASFPTDRAWDLERLYDPDPEVPRTSYVRNGGFISDVADFDPGFFGIAPREALAMDPQQRLLLEVTWEAIEDAGFDPSRLQGSRTGVFAGAMYSGYGPSMEGAPEDLEGYFGTGLGGAVASGRIAYTLGLEGPAITIDTACSSSLVALHLASQALRGGECSLALAGGVTVLALPMPFIELSRQRTLAPDGRSKSFAEAADGVGWSEGIGMLVLERLSDAEHQGHPILATIRGSAVNQDGASNGLTAPNGPSQERVIREALANARLSPQDVDAVEAHGTGTILGDPIEAGALLATYGQNRERPLKLGSIKSNIGHTQAAAGAAGVIKTVMAMREGVLPKTLHVDAPTSKVDWEAGQIELLREAEPWEQNGRPRRAAVSSFGIGGTNAHLILEEAPEPEPAGGGDEGNPDAGPGASAVATPPLPGLVPLALSAKSEEALREGASRLATHLRDNPGLDLTDVACSLATTRSSFERRAVVVGREREGLLAALGALAAGGEAPGLVGGIARGAQRPVFLFSGHGSQWQGMALELLDSSPVFATHMRACEGALSPYMDRSLREALLETDEQWLDRVDVVQPALFAISVSLARLWEELGVRPVAVAGHSQGEIAAAHIAGGLSLQDAARLAAMRSQLIATLSGQGGLASVALPAEELGSRLERWEGRIEVAAINGPASTILSGDREALDELLTQWSEEDIRVRPILGAVAPSHSAHVEVLREEVLKVLAPIAPQSGEIPFHSTVTGGPLDTAELDAEYWYRNMRQPVLFEPVTRGILEQGHRLLIEVSPHPVFTFAVGETIESTLDDPAEATLLGTLRRKEGGPDRFALSLAEAHAAGAKLDWQAFFAGSGAKRVPLPTYPFQRKRYWLEPASGGGDPVAIGQASAEHPMLGASLSLASGEQRLLTGRLSLATHPWLADHAVAGTPLLPGTGFVELALRAGAEVGCETIEELMLQAPLIPPEEGAAQIQVAVGAPDERGRREVSIYSRIEADGGGGDQEWTLNAEGVLSAAAVVPPESPSAWPPPGAEPLEIESLYERLDARGVEYGPSFQGLTAAWRDGDTLYSEASLAAEEAREAPRFGLHPALFDSTVHAGLDLSLTAAEAGGEERLMLPFAWRGVSLSARGATTLRMRVELGENGTRLSATDGDGAAVVSVDAVVARPIEPGALEVGRGGSSLHRVEWGEVSVGGPSLPRFAILGERAIAGLEAERYADVAALRTAIEAGASAPEVVLVEAEASEQSLPEAFHASSIWALSLLQEWVAEESLTATRLAFLTRGAIAAGGEESPDLGTAPVWGIVRAAQAEHPDRFLLVDVDGSEPSQRKLPALLAAAGEEPQVAIRDGKALVPRLAPVRGDGDGGGPQISPDSTVLITGGTGAIGVRVARHLVERHDARHLLLASRRGEAAKGAVELRAELEELGAEVTIAACDVGDRAQLEGLLSSIPPEHPLGAVIHSAAVLDDGVLEALSPERFERVLGPKADAAWYLHELTAGLDLSQFLLFSSGAGVLGGTAQANYAAANTFLDALAAHRRALGLPATSLAWGFWGAETNLADVEDRSAATRLAEQVRMRFGFAPMALDHALELFDAARTQGDSLLVPGDLDRSVLAAKARGGTLPAILRGVVRAPVQRGQRAGSLSRQLAGLPEGEREAAVLDLVRTNAAAVLGHDGAAEIDPERAFRDLGFDSLAAVELRNRLGAATGLRLPPTLVFDYPSAAALTKFLYAEVKGEARPAATVPRAATSPTEPIAIIGMSCRYPGGVGSPEELWSLVASGGDAIEAFPTDRGWDLERLYDPDPDVAGSTYLREGGFMANAADFDPAFFGISPREALAVDPQQRLLLEASWEAIEDAGIDPRSLRGSQAGVFAGVMYQDYGSAQGGVAPGMSTSAISGRVSYTLGLEGPAITVDTACSSSLVALHLACRALRDGDCTLALAGGVTVLATPTMMVYFGRQRALAPDGRCKAFAEGADGTGVSEGIGLLALERLSDARANGHRVLAVLRGSAVNQDGASNGFSAPNGPSQERVIRQALADARLVPGDIDAVEAHGTGTTLGDPIEAGAILATYGQGREEPVRLGSIKSNIGHAQAAAGVAGVIKMTMAMRAGVLPKTLHVDRPSSKVDWGSGRVELLSEEFPWQPNGRPRRAAISSFGASGTNAHMILEEPPAPEAVAVEAEGDAPVEDRRPLLGPVPFVLSAKSEGALHDLASRTAARLRDDSELDPNDVAYSLATTRSSFERRAVVLGLDRKELLSGLDALARGKPLAGTAAGVARAEHQPVFLFPGQGSQWPGMGLELLDSSPVFAAHMRACEEALAPHVDWCLEEVLREQGASWLDRLDIVQPALFAVMVSLAGLWRELGVSPAGVVGHSQGEIAAAHIAGALSLEDAALVVARRAGAMAKIAGKGAMLSVSLPPAELRSRLEPFGECIALAAINGPASLALSGEPDALEELRAACEEDGVRAQPIAVDYAAHSAQIDELEEELLEAFEPISPRSGQIPFYSTVSGKLLDTAELGPEYWYRNLRETVLFEPVLRSLLERGRRTFLEISPHPVLAFGVQETIADAEGAVEATVLSTLRREDGGPERFSLSLAEAHAHGVPLDWEAFFNGSGAKRVSLPTYPFQRKRYWLDSTLGAGNLDAAGLGDPGHPVLGAMIESPQGEITFTGRLSTQSHPWLAENAVFGAVLFPGAAFIELALRAAAEVGCEAIEELTLRTPLALVGDGAVQLQASVSGPDGEGKRELQIHSRSQGGAEGEDAKWVLNAEGVLSPDAAESPEPLVAWPPPAAEPIEVDSLYERLTDAGLEYGPAFQGLTCAWRDGGKIYAEVSLAAAQAQEATRYAIHPALLDAALHGVGLAGDKNGSEGPMLPFSFSGVALRKEGASELRVRIEPEGEGTSLALYGSDGSPLARVGSLVRRALPREQLREALRPSDGLLAIEWNEVSLSGVEETEEAELWRCELDPEADPAEAAKAATEQALSAIQGFLSSEAAGEKTLAILTEGAVAAEDGEDPDPAAAAVWGLARAAQTEHPDRLVLIDIDDSQASQAALPDAITRGESQLALREGTALAPQVVRLPGEPQERGLSLDPERTVLVTGGGDALGALLARHLVEGHGARHVLLLSDDGEEDASAALGTELEALGCKVRVEVCDPADRTQLEQVLGSIAPAHPLGAVLHATRVLDDGVIGFLDAERLERTMRPKVDAAWHLHELTRDLELSEFLLFSSATCALSGAGQANYAAANAFLDALAVHRHGHQLPARALAWGWTETTDEAGEQEEAVRARLGRLGLAPMGADRALELFDAACARTEPLLLVTELDIATLRGQVRTGVLPPVLRGLVSIPARRQSEGASFAKQLAAAPEEQRQALALGFIRGQIADVLGHASGDDVDPDRAFQELGFDSLGAVELRNRLAAATDLRLPPTLVFDYPSALALAGYLVATIAPTAAEVSRKDEIEDDVDDLSADDLAEMSHDEVFALIDEELDEEEEGAVL
jgi:acyl transferase domain-containing protein/NAD(P)-dependent dehydrogenase (short-subunit alcohol dehydrogenase family)/acyl carrier protein